MRQKKTCKLFYFIIISEGGLFPLTLSYYVLRYVLHYVLSYCYLNLRYVTLQMMELLIQRRMRRPSENLEVSLEDLTRLLGEWPAGSSGGGGGPSAVPPPGRHTSAPCPRTPTMSQRWGIC